MTKEELISFEDNVKLLFESGKLPYLIHFSGGNEDQLIEIFKDIKKDDWIFSTHRSHYHYLLYKNDPDKLLDMIKNGKSMHIFDDKFFTSSIVAGTCAIAVGVAKALEAKNSNNWVWCFIGDGAEDEGHYYEAAKYASSWDLPITFIIEDNNLSVDTPKIERWGSEFSNYNDNIKRYKYQRKYPHVQTGKLIKDYL